MEFLENILSDLGVNGSYYYQFGIFVVMYVLCKYGFLTNMLKILSQRDEMTVGVSHEADAMSKEAKEIESQYEQKVKSLRDDFQISLKKEQEVVATSYAQKIDVETKKLETELTGYEEECLKALENVKSQLKTKKSEHMAQLREKVLG